MSFSRFPVELHLQVLCFMDPEDILKLRKISQYFLALTHKPALWTAVYHRMRKTHPLNCSESEFAALTRQQTERLLVRASKTQNVFQTFRKDALFRIFHSEHTRTVRHRRLVALSFLSERFLLSADNTTVVYVWDLRKMTSSADAPVFPCARLTVVGWNFLAHSISIEHSTLYVVLFKSARAHIFSLALSSNTPDADEPELTFRDVAYFDIHSNDVCAIDPDLCLVLLHISHTMIEIVDWRTGDRSIIPLFPHSCSNNVIAMCVCGPYVLCFRWYSIEAYPIPHQFLQQPQAHATHRFLPDLRLATPRASSVSLSNVRRGRSPSGDTLFALAWSTQSGNFHYEVHVHTVPTPALSARLLAVEDLAENTDGYMPSSWALGSAGFRGMRFKYNAHGERLVVAFTTLAEVCQGGYPELLDEYERGLLLPEVAPRFEDRVVFVMPPTRCPGDNLNNCAVSEFTGRIALGAWDGVITLI